MVNKIVTSDGDDISMKSDNEDETEKAEAYKNKGNEHFKGKWVLTL